MSFKPWVALRALAVRRFHEWERVKFDIAAHRPRVAELNIAGREFSGKISAELGSLANMEELGLFGNQLTGKQPFPDEYPLQPV